MTDWNPYFDEVEPNNWRFLDFYQYRKRQPNFSNSFRKESFVLKKSLEKLMEKGSRKAKERAKTLLDAYKKQRVDYEDVNIFWNTVETVKTKHEELELKKIEAVQSIYNGAINYTDEVFTSAIENLRSERKRSMPEGSNNGPITPKSKIRRVTPDESPPTMSVLLYEYSSPDSSNDENEIVEVNKRIDYFTGPGVPEWNLNEESIRWVVSDVDISRICFEYRATVVKKCESMENTLSAIEELALSHVFVFQEENPCGLYEYFDEELWDEIFTELRKLYPYASVPEKVYELYTNIIKIACERPNLRERQTNAKHYLQKFEAATEKEMIMVEIFKDLIDNDQSSFTEHSTIEDTHSIRNVTPIIVKPFFKSNRKVSFEGANKMSESSATARREFDPVLLGTKPDFTIKTTNPKKHVELLIGEIKPPKTKNALILEDLISLGKTMKCALDKSIKDNVYDLTICGLQVIGFLVRAYVMDLQFDGLYRMFLIGEFELPRNYTSWGVVLQCYQVMNTIRDIVNNGAAKYQSSIRINTNQTNLEKIK